MIFSFFVYLVLREADCKMSLVRLRVWYSFVPNSVTFVLLLFCLLLNSEGSYLFPNKPFPKLNKMPFSIKFLRTYSNFVLQKPCLLFFCILRKLPIRSSCVQSYTNMSFCVILLAEKLLKNQLFLWKMFSSLVIDGTNFCYSFDKLLSMKLARLVYITQII